MLKLAELLMVILDCRPRLPLAAAAALVREPHGDGLLVRVVFLDARREPLAVDADTLLVTSYLAGRLDEDLAAAFGDRNVVILK
jgi:chorismate-pyruvate lyase